MLNECNGLFTTLTGHAFITAMDRELFRRRLSLAGYTLVGCSALWSRTCAMGGFHCFDGGYGLALAVAQFGVLAGLVCSFFGTGVARPLFVVIALADLACCYRQLLVH